MESNSAQSDSVSKTEVSIQKVRKTNRDNRSIFNDEDTDLETNWSTRMPISKNRKRNSTAPPPFPSNSHLPLSLSHLCLIQHQCPPPNVCRPTCNCSFYMQRSYGPYPSSRDSSSPAEPRHLGMDPLRCPGTRYTSYMQTSLLAVSLCAQCMHTLTSGDVLLNTFSFVHVASCRLPSCM